MAKEAAFLLPLLAVVLAHAREWRPGDALDRRGLPAAAAMACALAVVFVVRTLAIGGLGGYSEESGHGGPHRARHRLLRGRERQPVAARAAPHPLLLAVPLATGGSHGLRGVWRLRRGPRLRGGARRARLVRPRAAPGARAAARPEQRQRRAAAAAALGRPGARCSVRWCPTAPRAARRDRAGRRRRGAAAALRSTPPATGSARATSWSG